MRRLPAPLRWRLAGVGLLAAISPLWVRFAAASAGVSEPISWSKPRVEVFLTPAEVASRQLSFVSDEALSHVAIEVTSGISGFVAVEPSSLGNIAPGQQTALTVSLHVPEGRALGTYRGAIEVRRGSSPVPSALEVTIHVWPRVESNGVELHYPPEFGPDSQTVSLGGPVTLTTFRSAYGEGGVIPAGGAEIDVTRETVGRRSVQAIIGGELAGTSIEKTDTVAVDGITGRRVFYTSTFGENLTYRNVAVYAPRTAYVYKFFLSYGIGDAHGTDWLRSFERILESVRFDRPDGPTRRERD